MQRWRWNHSGNPGAVWLRDRTQNLPSNGTSCRLNPHNQLGKLCVYEYTKGNWEVPQQKAHYQMWTIEARRRGRRTRLESQVSPQQIQRPAGIGGKVGLIQREGKEATTEIQEKHLLSLYFKLSHSCFWIFFSFFLFLHSVATVADDFISTIKSIYAFKNFFKNF